MVKNIVFTKVVTGIVVVPNICYQIIVLMLLSYLFEFDTEKNFALLTFKDNAYFV